MSIQTAQHDKTTNIFAKDQIITYPLNLNK